MMIIIIIIIILELKSTKNYQNEITTNIGKRNLSGAQIKKLNKTKFP